MAGCWVFFIVLRNNRSNNFQRYYNSVACLQFVVSSAQVTHRTITSIQWVAFEFARVMTVAFRFKLVLGWKHKGQCVPVCTWACIWVRTCVGTALYSRIRWWKLCTRTLKLINKHVALILKYLLQKRKTKPKQKNPTAVAGISSVSYRGSWE